MKIIELREYKIKPGKTEEWIQWMNDELLPYQHSKGMLIIDTYLRTDDNGVDFFVWLREFESEDARQRIYKETYNDWWITVIRPKVFTLIDEHSINVKLLYPAL
ncbi:NIPSNAP family protein [Vibrio hannami]|uniref:NIPSNAP family protein n=1 Tax=Vibrio hannami TaxID=2717094 RepID=UPI0024109F73|nr:NIPSNAP family protein [Vibrio hannami]MDG3085111.1 NIPSNAP family protein [Vibrio hannami]